MKLRVALRAFSYVAAMILLLAPAVFGQVPAPTASDKARPEQSKTILLDRPVDRASYRLGPGDVVSLTMLGDSSRQATLTVGPEGTIVIPDLGPVRVLGLSLDQAEANVRRSADRYYRNFSVSLTLVDVRRFNVFLVGQVPKPGVQSASAVTRVSELITPEAPGGLLRRNVLVRRATGDTLQADLARFSLTGEARWNPTVLEGDAIIVPSIDQTVSVYGFVPFPGVYEYRAGEPLADLLMMVTATRGFAVTVADTVRVTRFVDRVHRENLSFSRQEALGAKGKAFILAPFDAVFVASVSNYKMQQTASVLGEVVRPGIYPIEPGVTTIGNLIALAGGLTEFASLTTSTLKRATADGRDRAVEQLRRVPPELLTPDDRQLLQILGDGATGNVVTDFEASARGGAMNIPLENGDALTVRRRATDVSVLGAVTHPGLVRWAPNATTKSLIEGAGDFTKRARKSGVEVVRARDGTHLPASDVRTIDPGDMIVVPFKEDVTWREVLQTTSLIVTTVVGLVLSFGAIF